MRNAPRRSTFPPRPWKRPWRATTSLPPPERTRTSGSPPRTWRPPFFVIRTYTPMDVTMGGLMVNEKMQVLSEDDAVIEGLYAIGNTAGGFYGGIDYDLEVDAFSLGRAVTTGRLAAQYAVE